MMRARTGLSDPQKKASRLSADLFDVEASFSRHAARVSAIRRNAGPRHPFYFASAFRAFLSFSVLKMMVIFPPFGGLPYR